MRGEIFALKPLSGRGHEQKGRRFGVVVQSDDIALSTVMVAPTSASARSYPHRPRIMIGRRTTHVLVEQMRVLDVTRLGLPVGRVTSLEMQEIDDALRLVLELTW